MREKISKLYLLRSASQATALEKSVTNPADQCVASIALPADEPFAGDESRTPVEPPPSNSDVTNFGDAAARTSIIASNAQVSDGSGPLKANGSLADDVSGASFAKASMFQVSRLTARDCKSATRGIVVTSVASEQRCYALSDRRATRPMDLSVTFARR